MNILKHTEYVKKLLTEKPHLRDDDCKLISNVWHKELLLKGIDSRKITAFEFMKMFSEGKLAHPESVMRTRRKLQSEFIPLQGEKWAERHKETENVKKQLYETPNILAGGTP
tara:strand:+ start:3173 stop:3508 length:336 start_codon:yes stop_codon:yes gene_type:complete